MVLRINQNAKKINNHRTLQKKHLRISKSLSHLSLRPKFSVARKGSAAVITSEKMRALIGTLDLALKKSELSVSMLESAEEKLGKLNSILAEIRQLTIHAANECTTDAAMAESDQDEITHLLSSIGQLLDCTKSGPEKRLDCLNNAAEIAEGEEVFPHVDIGDESTVSAGGKTLRYTTGNRDYVELADLDFVAWAQISGLSTSIGNLVDIDVRFIRGAQKALIAIDSVVEVVTEMYARIGAFQKKTLEVNIANMRIASENIVAAESNVRDVDMTLELANYTRQKLMLNSPVETLIRTNQVSRQVLTLRDN
jgi:flagellin